MRRPIARTTLLLVLLAFGAGAVASSAAAGKDSATPASAGEKNKPVPRKKKKPKVASKRLAARPAPAPVNPKALVSKAKIEWNVLKMRGPPPPLRTLAVADPLEPRRRASRRFDDGSAEASDILANRGVAFDMQDGWRMRLSVDSTQPSELGDRPQSDMMGLETVGPTIRWERKF